MVPLSRALGEYTTLAALGNLMTVKELAAITWFRGLNMRLVVQHDAHGRSPYAMVAVNPSKISDKFSEADLHTLVNAAALRTGELLEVVNHSITELQYVCAGTRHALSLFTDVLAAVSRSVDITNALNACEEQFESSATNVTEFVELRRTHFSTPLRGVDVPFHSSFLRPGIEAYRDFLLANLTKDSVKPEKLIGRWIPNVTGHAFRVTKEDFKEVQRLSNSDILRGVLERWLEVEDAIR
jgi:fatty acid synthase subunit beta